MFRKIDNSKYTAHISTKGDLVTISYDDGWENLISSRITVANEAAGRALLLARGYEEFDPNADLKAAGFVWDGCSYVKPRGAA